MANDIKFDISDFLEKAGHLDDIFKLQMGQTINNVAEEVLRLSQFQVPHDTGLLQNSGHVERRSNEEAIVGYNKVYAARLHEHPEYRFGKGRKGKYLEDPIKTNTNVFIEYFKTAMSGILK